MKLKLFLYLLLLAFAFVLHKANAQDVVPPTLQASTISDDSNYSSAYLSYTLTFDENVTFNQSTNMFRLYRSSGGSYINMSSSISEVGSNYVSFEYPSLLNNGESYALLVDPNAVEDLSGNGYAGITDVTTLNFTASWEEPVESKSPTQNESGVAIDANLTLSFDRNIKIGRGGMSGATIISLRVAAGLAVVEEVTFDSPNVTLGADYFTFNPSTDLDYNTQYRVIVNPHIVETDGEDGKTWSGLISASGDDSWYFRTEQAPDLDAPTISIQSPTDGAIDVSRSNNIVCTFSEDIVLGSGTIKLGYVGVSGQQFATYSIPSATEVTVSGDQLIINPATDMPPLEDIYVSISAGTVEDLAGNDFEGIIDEESWNFTTIDDVAPLALGFTPYDGSTYGVLSATSSFYFNEDMQEGSGTISLYKADHTLVESISTGVSDARIGFPALWRITLDFDTDLEELVEYYITISDGAFEDLAGNAYAGVAAGDWSFTANARPHISTLTPANGATDVAIDAEFSMEFDMSVSTNSEAAILIKNYDTDAIIETISIADMEGESGIITFSPSLLTLGLHAYIILEETGRLYATNNGENFMGLDDKDDWDFTTDPGDVDGPQIVSFSPLDDATDVPFDGDLVVTFDEPIVAGSSYIRVRHVGNGQVNFGGRPEFETEMFTVLDNTLTLHLAEASYIPMTNGRDYYVEILNGAVKDEAGNLFDGEFTDVTTWNFNTGYATGTNPPQLVSFSPLDEATGVPFNGDLVVTFDKPIVAGNGTVRVRSIGSGQVNFGGRPEFETEMFTVLDNTLTLHLAEASYIPMTNGRDYYVEILNGAVRDEIGNSFDEEFTGETTWNFTTGPALGTQTPQIVSVSPASGATGVDLDQDITVTFDKDIVGGSAYFRLKTKDGDNNKLGGRPEFETDLFSVDGSTLTIHLANWQTTAFENSLLLNGVEYYADMDFGTIMDLDGNSFEGLDDKEFWSFTMEPPVTPVSLSPENNATDVSVNVGSLTMQFDREMLAGTGTFRIRNVGSNQIVQEFDMGTEEVTFIDDQITLTDVVDLSPNTSYWVQNFNSLPSQSAKDLEGNALLFWNTDATWSFTTGKRAQTITIESIEDKLISDGAFEVVASTDSELDLTYEISGPGIISGTTITLTGESGLIFVTVSQAGNDTYDAASAQVTFNVIDPSKTNQAITFNPIADQTFGDQSFELSATASSGLEVSYAVISGPITLIGNMVTITGAGEAVISADQSGDENFNAAQQVMQSFTIDKATQIIEIEPISDKLTTTEPFMVSATVDTGLPLIYEVSGPATVSGATVTLSGETGAVTVTVTQAGDDNHLTASSETAFMVVDIIKSDQTITFAEIADKIVTDAAFTITGTASSELAVTFTVVSGPVTIDENELTITGVGTAVIAANQEGDENFNPAQEITQSFEISKANQTITITTIDDKLTTDGSFEVLAQTNSDLLLSYTIAGPATINETTITLDGTEGTVTVTVSQPGNETFNAAEESISFEVISSAVTSVEDRVAQVQFYPNPATEWIQIEGLKSDQAEVQIFDTRGMTVMAKTLTSQDRLSISRLQTGMYIMKITDSKITTTTKLIIRR